MKKTFILAALLAIVAVAGAWQPGKHATSTDAGIKARCEAFAAAWNKHDPAAMAACWSPDGDLINPFGRVAKGRTAVEQLFTDEHKSVFKSSRMEQKITGTRSIADGSYAFIDWDVTVTNAHADDGSAMPPTTYHVALLAQKAKDGTWWFEAARPYVYLPEPKAKPATK